MRPTLDGFHPTQTLSAYGIYPARRVPLGVPAESISPRHAYAIVRPPDATRPLAETANLHGWDKAFHGAAVHILYPHEEHDDKFIVLAACSWTNMIKVREVDVPGVSALEYTLRHRFGLRDQIYVDRTAPFGLAHISSNVGPFRLSARDFSRDLRPPAPEFDDWAPRTTDSVFTGFLRTLHSLRAAFEASDAIHSSCTSIVAAHNVTPQQELNGYSPIQAFAAVTTRP